MNPIDLTAVSDEHFARIHRAALVLTGNPWDADDLAQETFLVLARQHAQFAGRSSMYTWLYGILLNLDRRQRRRWGVLRRKLRVLWDAEVQRPSSAAPADAPVAVAEWRSSLWSLVARLPDGQRHALVLRYSEGLSYEAIADALECPVGTVKSRVFNGLAALRRLTTDESIEDLAPPRYPQEDLKHVV